MTSTVLEEYPSHFSAQFVEYCRVNQISSLSFRNIERIPRFLRIKSRVVESEAAVPWFTLEELSNDLGTKATPVHWLPGDWFCQVDRSIAIGSHPIFKEGKLISMDAASIASVLALQPCVGEMILDLCCAPGMKLALIADAVGWNGGQGLAVGVDLSVDRLFVTRSTLQKYDSKHVRLYQGDGRSFNMNPTESFQRTDPVMLEVNSSASRYATRKQKFLQYLKRASRRLGERPKRSRSPSEGTVSIAPVPTDESNSSAHHIFHQTADSCPETPAAGEFDKVLVDAECTHDGSIAHLLPSASSREGGGESGDPSSATCTGDKLNFCISDDNSTLHDLQFALLAAGFANVKVGGTLVYSTCSFSKHQNEGIVRRFLEASSGKAKLVDPFSRPECPKKQCAPFVDCEKLLLAEPSPFESADGCIRFTPQKSNTSFQFIARFLRLA